MSGFVACPKVTQTAHSSAAKLEASGKLDQPDTPCDLKLAAVWITELIHRSTCGKCHQYAVTNLTP